MPIRTGRYQHWKGRCYDVIGEGIHTESDEVFVVYTDAGAGRTGRLYLRPRELFLAPVPVELGAAERFVFVRELD